MSQLTLDGRSGPATEIAPAAPLSAAQRQILRMLADGELSSSDAGRVIHAHRQPPCARCQAAGSCTYASSDGLAVMKRLEARGLARHIARGRWSRT